VDILKQFGLIIAFSFVGEILHAVLPLPVPASIYGIVLLFICLRAHVLHVIQIRETSSFLIEAMPVMFIPSAVGIMDSWSIISQSLIPYVVIIAVALIVVMAVSGLTTQYLIRRSERRKETTAHV
jgi:holin-like protein